MWKLSTYCCVWALDHVGITPSPLTGGSKTPEKKHAGACYRMWFASLIPCMLQAYGTLISDRGIQDNRHKCWVFIKALNSLRDVAKHSSPNVSIHMFGSFFMYDTCLLGKCCYSHTSACTYCIETGSSLGDLPSLIILKHCTMKSPMGYSPVCFTKT